MTYSSAILARAGLTNPHVHEFVAEWARILTPDRIEVVGADDLDAVGGEDAGPLGDEFVDMGVGQTGPREDRGGVRHGGSNRRAGPRGRRRRPGPEGPCGEHRRKFAYAKLWELHVEALGIWCGC